MPSATIAFFGLLLTQRQAEAVERSASSALGDDWLGFQSESRYEPGADKPLTLRADGVNCEFLSDLGAIPGESLEYAFGIEIGYAGAAGDDDIAARILRAASDASLSADWAARAEPILASAGISAAPRPLMITQSW